MTRRTGTVRMTLTGVCLAAVTVGWAAASTARAAAAETPEARPLVQIALLLDTSGSMS